MHVPPLTSDEIAGDEHRADEDGQGVICTNPVSSFAEVVAQPTDGGGAAVHRAVNDVFIYAVPQEVGAVLDGLHHRGVIDFVHVVLVINQVVDDRDFLHHLLGQFGPLHIELVGHVDARQWPPPWRRPSW